MIRYLDTTSPENLPVLGTVQEVTEATLTVASSVYTKASHPNIFDFNLVSAVGDIVLDLSSLGLPSGVYPASLKLKNQDGIFVNYTSPIMVVSPGFLVAGNNSYCTLLEANDYHTYRLGNDEWMQASSALREFMLISACRFLESIKWIGSKASDQLLQWPRFGYSQSQLEFEFDDDESISSIPKAVKDAQAEIAYQLLCGDEPGNSDSAVASTSGVHIRTNARLFTSDIVTRLLSPYTTNMVAKVIRS